MQLQKELKKEQNAKVTVRVTVDKSSVNESIGEIVQELEKRSKIPGFRKGKVPTNLVFTHFAKHIKDETISKVLTGSLEQILKEEDFRPISEPVVVEMGDLSKDSDFSFRAEFDVMPEVTLPVYKGVSSDKYVYTIGDDDVAKEIEGLRDRFSTLVGKEGKAEDGDYLVVDYERHDDKGALINKKQEQTVFLDEKNDSLSGELIGLAKGDEKSVTLPLKKGTMDKPAAGETAQDAAGDREAQTDPPGLLKVTVKEVKKKELPALGDDFAKDISDVDTLDDLRKKIREELEKAARDRSEEKTKEELIGKLIEKTSVELPETLVNNEIVQLLANVATAYKIDPRKLFKDEAQVAEYRKSLAPKAVRNVKYDLIMNEIAKNEKIEVSESELDQEIEKYAKIGKKDFQSVKDTMTKNRSLDQLKYRVRQNKALDLVYRSANLEKTHEIRFGGQERSE
jgi:trigger factor